MTARPLRVAVDAGNLAHDRRGMGRIARATLAAAGADPSIALTLLAAGRAAAALRAEFPGAAFAAPGVAARRGRFDVVWFPFNGMRFVPHAPAVVTIHDAFAFAEPHRDRVARFREQQPIRRAARRATLVVTDSAWSRAQISRELRVDAARVTVVLPEPDPFWSPGPPGDVPAPLAGRAFALLVGAREPRKNASLALEASARALRGPDELLVVVGALPEPLRARARALGLRCGEISAGDATLRALYRTARAVLVPSLAEGFGLVAVEAMACGAPVLAADAAALPEATGGAVPLLDPRDPAVWAAYLRRTFDDAAYAAELGARGAARFPPGPRASAARATLALLRATALA